MSSACSARSGGRAIPGTSNQVAMLAWTWTGHDRGRLHARHRQASTEVRPLDGNQIHPLSLRRRRDCRCCFRQPSACLEVFDVRPQGVALPQETSVTTFWTVLASVRGDASKPSKQSTASLTMTGSACRWREISCAVWRNRARAAPECGRRPQACGQSSYTLSTMGRRRADDVACERRKMRRMRASKKNSLICAVCCARKSHGACKRAHANQLLALQSPGTPAPAATGRGKKMRRGC